MPDMKVVDPFAAKHIIDKDNVSEHLTATMDVITPTVVSGVAKGLIPVSIQGFKEFVFTEVAPGTKVPPHHHTEGPLLRVITSGEAVVNGKQYNQGDWMVIPKGHDYAVETSKGYTAAWICARCE